LEVVVIDAVCMPWVLGCCFWVTVLLVVLCIVYTSVTAADYLEAAKVRLVDYTPKSSGLNNFVFRGNEPKLFNNTSGNDYFAYDALKTYMANVVSQANVTDTTFPSRFLLHDIKLYYFDDPLESPDIVLEQDFFSNNPSLGDYTGWQIWGDSSTPQLLPSYLVDEWAKTLPEWQHDALPTKIPWLNKQLHTKESLPSVYYFHCECGCDRTGEIAGAYMMNYRNMTYNAAMAWNFEVAGRWILINHEWAVQWYCYYLNLVQGFSIPSCVPNW